MLAKSKQNVIGALISKDLTGPVISQDEFVLINNAQKTFYKTMLSNYLKCRKITESKNPNVGRTKNGRIILLSKCALYDSKKSKFIKRQEVSGLLSS